MRRESLEFPGSIEGTIKFDQIACCALAFGFDLNPEAYELVDIVGPDKFQLFRDILNSTEEMKFVPSEEMKTIYTQIAKMELRRLEAVAPLECGHLTGDHKKALRRVVEMMGIQSS